MARWWRVSSRSDRRRKRSVGFDAMEDRVLLSTAPSHLTFPVVVEGPVQPVVSIPATSPGPAVVSNAKSGTEPGSASFGDRAKFVVNTVVQGRSMVYSHNIRAVGYHYAKLGFSHDTRKLGLAYLRAVIRGNGKTINQLNHTNLAKKIGHQFDQLTHSRKVKNVGDAFSSFGRGVANQFHRLFGHKSVPARPRPTGK
jgi:hypothetical protein